MQATISPVPAPTARCSLRQDRCARPWFSSFQPPWPNSLRPVLLISRCSRSCGTTIGCRQRSCSYAGSRSCGPGHAALTRATAARSWRNPRLGAGGVGGRATASASARSLHPSPGPGRLACSSAVPATRSEHPHRARASALHSGVARPFRPASSGSGSVPPEYCDAGWRCV